MSADRGEAMREARHLDGQRKRTLILAAVDAAHQQGQVLTIAGIARTARVGRKFVYDHPDLRTETELTVAQVAQRQANDMIAAARVTGTSSRADQENSRAHNRRLQQQLRSLENRLSELEGARLVADELPPTDVVTQFADHHLAQRVAELEPQLFKTEEALRQAEELDAARAVNRQLIHRANSTDPSGSPSSTTRAHRQTEPRPTTAIDLGLAIPGPPLIPTIGSSARSGRTPPDRPAGAPGRNILARPPDPIAGTQPSICTGWRLARGAAGLVGRLLGVDAPVVGRCRKAITPVGRRTPTSRCRFATADRQGRVRGSHPGAVRAATGTQAGRRAPRIRGPHAPP